MSKAEHVAGSTWQRSISAGFRFTWRPGEYAINGPGVWHTADVDDEATALFITTGWGTEHRPRSNR